METIQISWAQAHSPLSQYSCRITLVILLSAFQVVWNSSGTSDTPDYCQRDDGADSTFFYYLFTSTTLQIPLQSCPVLRLSGYSHGDANDWDLIVKALSLVCQQHGLLQSSYHEQTATNVGHVHRSQFSPQQRTHHFVGCQQQSQQQRIDCMGT